MKIVNRKTFLALPENTLFAKYEPCVFGDLSIKMSTLDNGDFGNQQIVDAIEAPNSEYFIKNLIKAENGASIEMNFDYFGRDGCFDERQLFVVFEKQDVFALIERLKRCL